MRYSLIIILIFYYVSAFGQKQDIEIIEERSDSEIKLFAINNTSDDLEMEFRLRFTGFTTNEKFPIVIVLKNGNKEYLVTLKATVGIDCEYSTSVSYKKIAKAEKPDNAQTGVRKMTGIQLNPEKINVFTKDGCSRCEYVINYLQTNNIPYLELNISIHNPNLDLMFEKMEEFGFKETNVRMPVVISRNKLDYNIGDLPGFVKNLK
ncbi:MAG: hypothetical protein IPL55_23220 [Saprospiraceae bacterium]|jgi:glutaredoxin|nr:hypothetical protein [Saprospiraceae bacterium]MBL0025351.1 hypothetical protein [Saprospiraceae bacterium]